MISALRSRRFELCCCLIAGSVLFATLFRSGHSATISLLALASSTSSQSTETPSQRQAGSQGESARSTITIDYPEAGSIFPPEITSPTFLWRDSSSATAWEIDIRFADGTHAIHIRSAGPPLQIGRIDPECISTTNKLPS